ncbi:MAG: lipolytic protein G-D-S-L family [Bacteroidaceae bacterium]|nr:lipolytic protein G-D-S-L family [Bacteroidaceae bacterium]
MAAAEVVKAEPTDENIARLREAVKLVRWTLINGNIEPGEEPVNILFIGNSITYGAGLSDRGTQAPPAQCAKKIAEQTKRQVFFQNNGVSGATTLNWLPKTALFRNSSKSAGELTNNGGYLFFSMMLGTNDSAESGPTGSPVSPEDYAANMKTIINKLHDTYPDARFIVNYPIWYSPNTHNGAVYMEAGLNRLKSYHPVIDQLVADLQAEGVLVWTGSKEAFSFFEEKPEYFFAENGYDGTFYLHPNPTGAEYLGAFWAQSIIEHLDTPDIVEWMSVGAPASTAVYNMQGQRIADAEPLAPGLYIVNGRKVAIFR